MTCITGLTVVGVWNATKSDKVSQCYLKISIILKLQFGSLQTWKPTDFCCRSLKETEATMHCLSEVRCVGTGNGDVISRVPRAIWLQPQLPISLPQEQHMVCIFIYPSHGERAIRSIICWHVIQYTWQFLNHGLSVCIYIFHILSFKVEKSCNDEHDIVRIINSSRTQRYIEKVRNTDCSVLESFQQCQTYFSKFLKIFKNIYDECFPVITVKTQYRNRLPWLTEGLKYQ